MVKARLLSVTILIVALSLILTWTLIAQAVEPGITPSDAPSGAQPPEPALSAPSQGMWENPRRKHRW